ncbi:hypothetical protein EG327_002903 [Venturia inaequalis]|uniref:PWI domain-containing protein n=1 Tax=Venturia inaequalis TaxID=5025 RepID=A0A8H3VI75_VENIN|nr:hypothetical protein EG327_002903 [Venturia inaequalis]
MSYYGQGPPGGYGGYSSSPPGAPGAGPPGASLPPGMSASQHPLPARPNLPGGFQAPANMPNINFNAPVIRLANLGGTPNQGSGGGRGQRDSNAEPMGNRRGLGMDGGRNIDQQRMQIQEKMMSQAPPTREEIARTIFVANITEGMGGDAGLERLLRAVGSLRRWTRAYDADNKPCTFGFAEFEDAESLETAAEVLQDVQVPLKKIVPKNTEKNGEAEGGEAEVVVDEASKTYATEWRERRKESEEQTQFRIDQAKENLQQVLNGLFHPTMYKEQDDVFMSDPGQAADPVTGEVITIQIAADDELADVPAEMRETVAAEIHAFRERSIRRDMERLKREEEAEKQNSRTNRLASPPASAPMGPSGGANGIPLGPRGVQGAPSGPKARNGPRDYQNGVAFTNGGGDASFANYIRDEDDTDASDEELERRRKEKKQQDEERAFLDHERKWLNRERTRTAAIEREKTRAERDNESEAEKKAAMETRLREFDDDEEAIKKTQEYYIDRSVWNKNRFAYRGREAEQDDIDRQREEYELNAERSKQDQARGMAESFLDRQAAELSARGVRVLDEPQRVKISLGAALNKASGANVPKRRAAAADIEGLLEDDENEDDTTHRTLIPIKFDHSAISANMTQEERDEAKRQLAKEIPNDKKGLWEWPIQWDSLDQTVVQDHLKPFIEKKVTEFLGIQEDELVQEIVKHVSKRTKPQNIVEDLEGPLDEEAETLVRKLWRMIIFFTESEKRGLGGS